MELLWKKCFAIIRNFIFNNFVCLSTFRTALQLEKISNKIYTTPE